MIGFFNKKYYIAICNSDVGFVERMLATLKSIYNNRIVVRTYTDSYKMFEALNISQSNNRPFDIAVFGENELAQKLVLKQTNPEIKVILCSNEKSLEEEVSKILT